MFNGTAGRRFSERQKILRSQTTLTSRSQGKSVYSLQPLFDYLKRFFLFVMFSVLHVSLVQVCKSFFMCGFAWDSRDKGKVSVSV